MRVRMGDDDLGGIDGRGGGHRGYEAVMLVVAEATATASNTSLLKYFILTPFRVNTTRFPPFNEKIRSGAISPRIVREKGVMDSERKGKSGPVVAKPARELANCARQARANYTA